MLKKIKADFIEIKRENIKLCQISVELMTTTARSNQRTDSLETNVFD